MKVTGKLTKTEWLLLALAAAFLAVLALLYLDASRTAAGTDYTISTQIRSAQPVTPEVPVDPEPKGPLNINTADADALQTLPGIGPALAGRIIDYREENGPFQSVDELVKVKGIGEATLERFRQEVTVDGAQGEAGENDDMQEDAVP